ncbi:hypothetical protein Pla175_48160 [Pirellulimonas nuda]|uniref:Squalene cyclase C-terminal domain-containing protein n=1 Tax=Pirellulimonas nuda TaxID=2528009 RepID=A0A518DIU5_9BACT|nr:hypothetical protein [Pirellulimonas nuda]QDU91394.1 hypothetical protein Pla175_48160 [Pirellulimonas nuda]
MTRAAPTADAAENLKTGMRTEDNPAEATSPEPPERAAGPAPAGENPSAEAPSDGPKGDGPQGGGPQGDGPAGQGPDDEPAPEERGGVWADVLQGSPSWLVSLAVHMLILIAFGLWLLPQLPKPETNLLGTQLGEVEDLDSIDDILLDPVDMEVEELTELQPDTEVLADEVSMSQFNELTEAPSAVELSDLGLTTAPIATPTDLQGFDGTGTTGRGQMARKQLVRRGGGNEASETAVGLALKWLAEHQSPDGSWSLIHNTGACQGRCGNPGTYPQSARAATALALLPFLGAGQTHEEGKYQRVVERGLAALVRMGKPENVGASWSDPGVPVMYCHGLASIVLCEALGMSDDSSLRAPAQGAIDFIVYAQDQKGGGWRYKPREPGDTSVVGWQIMALKSGHLAELSVPASTIKRANQFLDSVEKKNGYVYVPGNGRTTNSMTSVGLLCRMYMGVKQDDPGLIAGAKRIAKAGPSADDYYYNYYASQVLFQHTEGRGPMWDTWNEKMRDQLVNQQEMRGHLKGSWFVPDRHNDRAGRLYTTSLAAMTLEVYYRYLPIYGAKAVSTEFPE